MWKFNGEEQETLSCLIGYVMKMSAHEVEFKLGLAEEVDLRINLMAFQKE